MSATVMPEESLAEIEASRPIGSGHAGDVYWVRRRDGSELAVKRLDAMAIDRERIGRNCRRLMAVPRHPGVVPMVGYQIGVSPYFIASEWVAGGRTLDSLRGAVQEGEAWPLILGLAEALAHLHRHGVHHSNLHPGNVFIEIGTEIRGRVADAGPGMAGRVHHIDIGETAWFAPAEQLENPRSWEEGAVERWDVYRFGALAFWLINGVTPRGGGYRTLWERQMADGSGLPARVDLDELAADMRRQVAVEWTAPTGDRAAQLRREIIGRCLCLDPTARQVDMREVCEAFAAVERRLEAERAEERIHGAMVEAEVRVRLEKERQAARLQSVRLITACLLGSLLLVSALLARYFQRSHSFKNRVFELGLVVGHQKSQIEALDRHRSQSDHELRGAREAANAVFARIVPVDEAAGSVPEPGGIDWENLQTFRSYIERNLMVSADDPAKRQGRARDLHHLAHVETRLGLRPEARQRLREAVALFEEILADGNSGDDAARECEARLADCHEALAALIDRDPGDEKLAALREASRYLSILAERRPLDGEVARRRLAADFLLGRQWHEHGEFGAALAEFASAGVQLDRRIAALPDSLPLLEMLAEVQYHSALSLRESGRKREAADAFAAALETLARLTGEFAPTEEQSARMGAIYADLGELFLGKAPMAETVQLLNEAQRILSPIQERRPQHFETTIVLSRTLSLLARLDNSEHRWRDCYRMSMAAMERLEVALASDPGHIEARIALVEIRAGHVELARYQKVAAGKAIQAGFEMAEAIRQDLEADRDLPGRIRHGWQLRLARLYEIYGKLSASIGDAERARICQERANQAREWLAGDAPVPVGGSLRVSRPG
jgi:serine/threonine protein kinase